EGTGWTAEPAAGRAGAAVRPYFYLAGAPGAVLEDGLALVNPTDREHTVTLRGADAYNTADGAFAVRPPERPGPGAGPATGPGTGPGSWISFGRGATVRLPARTRAVVPFTVTLPPASAPGDHPAAIVAAEAGHETGVRVHLRVSGPAVAALTVEDVAVRGRGGAAVIAYTLVNRGNVALAPTLAVRADGGFGKAPGRAPHALPVELLPGQRVGLTEPWPGAPAFDRVHLTLTVAAPGAPRATATASAWCVPASLAGWAGPGLLALGATTAAALLLVRTRRIRRAPEPHEDHVPEHRPHPHRRPLTGAPR
ncbi:COG1470 family protein, partial [Streptomyces sp. NPDC054838]